MTFPTDSSTHANELVMLSCLSKTFRFSFYVLDSQKSITDCEIRILKSLCHCPLIVWITLHFKHVSLQVSSFDLLN